jgi:ATP-dependent RNA helicase DeaD
MPTFEELGVHADLLRGIVAMGFETPTPIQELLIPIALESDEDLVALAQTGTGKTAAFGLPLLQRLDPGKHAVQAMILCPTRELCVQVAGDLVNYSQFAPHYKIVAVYGGASIETQIRQIKAGAQIVCATPGRLVDLLARQAVSLDHVERVVLDEADEMLDMGFKDALDIILDSAQNRRSIWLFSATMPEEVREIAQTYMKRPRELSTGRRNQTNENIEHVYYVCRADDRFACLKRVVDANPGIYGLIFCRTKNDAKEVAEQMIRDGYNSDALHGDLAQSDRDRVMQRFRERNLQLLIATDVAARGIDVSDISHVINYGLPDEPEVYLHRSGRTGRAGRTGISISIITPKFESRIPLIERRTKAVFKKQSIPTAFEVCERQLFHIIQNIHDQEVHDTDIEPFMARIYEELKDLSKEELIKRFASVEFNRFLAYYRNAPDINIYPKGGKRGVPETRGVGRFNAEPQGNGQGPDVQSGMVRLFINVGEMDGVTKKDFVKLLSRAVGVPARSIGDIDLKKAYMHFAIDAHYEDVVRRTLSEFTINNRRLRIDDATPRKEGKEERFFEKWDKKGGKKTQRKR